MTGTSSGRRVISRDAAPKAGVSRPTGSHVLNNVPHQKIPEVTRRRVCGAADQSGADREPGTPGRSADHSHEQQAGDEADRQSDQGELGELCDLALGQSGPQECAN
ncbi:LacI family DNA-binding transcriptional regulator [Streptomyces europaeiscabiei]|uniref:hypothetical protein n=1 Tax=Streptomyces europaeiscabiei TaxID=146819 RepID=UPI002E182EC3|nr:LacI family DNA-binding transcriptional regulator [Streptomyces europaeiscabiei]